MGDHLELWELSCDSCAFGCLLKLSLFSGGVECCGGSVATQASTNRVGEKQFFTAKIVFDFSVEMESK